MGNKPRVPEERTPDDQLGGTLDVSQSRTLPDGSMVFPVDDSYGASISYRRGDKLGRFLIVDELGVGAMGVVVSAYDPDLDRKVAIKVLRSGVDEGESATQGQQRLVREAQAMAKLSHPNVVTVFEVGTLSDRVFVAMEYVEGHTLSAWLGEKPRSWQRIVEVFAQAGKGLAAAHAAGLVHRDFKPDNVLLRSNGIPCVADFGLASAAGRPVPFDESTPERLDALADKMPLNMTLTRTGQLLGTPAYMSPEQFEGHRVDARADQFSFCVALYEALFGISPYEGKTLSLLLASTLEGRINPPPPNTNVPRWVTEALTRGLRPDPDARHPSMESLIAALTKDPARGRRKRLLAGSVGLASLGVFALLASSAWTASQDRPCAGVADDVADVWSKSTRAAVKRAFSATGSPGAQETYVRVDRAMSSYVASWAAMRAEACEATFERREQSERLLDLRVQCLQRRREEADAVARLLARGPDRKLLGNAVQVTTSLTPLSACEDSEALLAAVPPPEDPAVRAKVEALRARLDQVAALNMANTSASFVEGTKIAEEVAQEAKGLSYRPIQAESLRWQGDMQYGSGDFKRAEATFGRALLAAAEARDDRLEAVVLTRLLRLMAYDQGRVPESLALIPVAEAATIRAKDDILRAQVVFENAFLVDEVGRGEEARREAERALAIAERALGPDHADVAEMIDFIGILLGRSGQFEEAVRFHQRAQGSMERALGPGHNRVAEVLNNLCKSYKDAGQYGEGQPVCERSISIAVNALGPGFQGVGCTRGHYAEVLCGQGKFDQGVKEARSAITLLEASVGTEHRWVAASLTALGICLLGADDPKGAATALERSLAMREKQPGHPIELAKTRFAMAEALWDSGKDKARARALALEAEQEYARAPGPPRVQLKAIRAWRAAHPGK